ncbi:M15 family metallopeptidase [Mongoliitalea daihaiensis]|uniref:M15 family metallopeptidase n=1 Tax=Mongoliitalea daihaiensis TaxID=2782006 RepID=UPI001F2F6935|nr:M15 family metallopeptidase [Mongoliitalea daihaiensis]UJP66710.1 M15 family metallopeptidase [Mongoliitalea daihaiensis]
MNASIRTLTLLSLILLFACETKMTETTATGVDFNDLVSIGDEQFQIVDQVGALEQSLIDAGLVDVEAVISGIFVDLKYSTEDNFFGKDVYGDLYRCYVQPIVADMLKKAHEKLQEEHPELTFLVYDGVRPVRVQQILWDNLDKPDSIKPLYVADPKVGGLHNYGVAVDLTLAYRETGEALDMGTPFDFFGYPAYPDREQQMLREGKITQEHINNREILRKVMQYGGFTGIGSEWWHFNAFSRKEAAERFGLVK